MKSATKVTTNTAILYCRMLLTMGISLYSTRVVLGALGNVDYGIFNLIAGVIAMLSFLNAAMSTSTQRYLSFNQGKTDKNIQKKIFLNSLLLHFLIGVIIVIGLEAASLFLFTDFLNIPLERVPAAKVVFHFMTGTVFFTIISVPFSASLQAHENMILVAIVNIIEVLLKLFVAISLVQLTTDKLIIFSLLTAGISILSCLFYAFYCISKYDECKIKNIGTFDKNLIIELTSFAGWNLFGTLCSLGRSQGLAVLLNVFFGSAINASYAISNQVAGQLNNFSFTMLQALNPQIMKSEGSGDRQRMLRLSMIASKFSFFLLAIIAIPCIFEMNSILTLWLKNVPEYTVIFCSLILAGTLTNQLTIGLQSALQATGKIKQYQAVVGGILLSNLPIAYILLKLGLPSYSVLISFICVELIACICRLLFAKKIAGLDLIEYLNRVFLMELVPIFASVLTCYLLTTYVDVQFRFLLTGCFSALVFLTAIYFFGLCPDEKELINGLISKQKSRFSLRKNELNITIED